MTVKFNIKTSGNGPPEAPKVGRGSKFACEFCGEVADDEYLKQEGQSGRLGLQLMAIAVDGPEDREYLEPTEFHENIARQADPAWGPNEELPHDPRGIWCTSYGLERYDDLFTDRQLLCVTAFSDALDEIEEEIINDSSGDEEYARLLTSLLALAVDRLAQTNNTLVRWLTRKSGTSKGTPAFDRQTMPMIWSFSEGNVFSSSVGSWDAAIKNVSRSFKNLPPNPRPGRVFRHDASKRFPIDEPAVVSTDPPYFDNISYANLSDFFYVWLRRNLKTHFDDLFETIVTPKKREIVANPYLFEGDREQAEKHFLEGLKKSFDNIFDVHDGDYPATVFYAFKQTEKSENSTDESDFYYSTGWETMLEALVGAGFQIVGTWPISTEGRKRMNAIGANALASSVVLACRPRDEDAPEITRREFTKELNNELSTSIEALEQANIAPVDLPQAAIGPGMSVYSKYSRVVEADGSRLSVQSALELINEGLDNYLMEQDTDIDRETRVAITWYDSYGFEEGPFGQLENLVKARNTSVSGLEEAGILESGGGKVRLLKRGELENNWRPSDDDRVTIWEALQQTIRALDEEGEDAAAEIISELGPQAEEIRRLAYRLHTICERDARPEEAVDYNSLAAEWPRLREIAHQISGDSTGPLDRFLEEDIQ